MLARTLAATPWGIDALPVEVEVDVHKGLPHLQLVGLPDAAVKESRDRVRAAIHNSGFSIKPRGVVINLAPADLKKEGNYLDLAIALTLLAGHEALPAERLERLLVCGELSLDGTLRPVRGSLAIAELARRERVKELLLPAGVATQAAALSPTLRVIPVNTLSDAVQHILGLERIDPARAVLNDQDAPVPTIDLAEVKGCALPRRALEIAAAGGHNLLMNGPPGTGKTMLARCLPGILPPLTHRESLEVTRVHSAAGTMTSSGAFNVHNALIRTRPFRSPHSSVSTPGLIGGGGVPKPGEVSLAHCGVLFLDELPEFNRAALESLRQPLEEGMIHISRARAQLSFPARFALVAAANPCPCGFLGDLRHDCRCSPSRLENYEARLSGPLLDRIDLRVEVPRVDLEDYRRTEPGESSAVVRTRVESVRDIQLARDGKLASQLSGTELDTEAMDKKVRATLERAYDRFGLSLRSVHRILRVTRTIADLAEVEVPQVSHLAEALQFRMFDQQKIDPAPKTRSKGPAQTVPATQD